MSGFYKKMCLFYSRQAQIVIRVALHNGKKKITRFILVKKDDENMILRPSFALTKSFLQKSPQFILLDLKISVSNAVFHLSISVFTVSLACLFRSIVLIQISEFNNQSFIST